jgi:hypothetical protein
MATAPAERPPAARFASFAEFWPFYVGEHSQPVTRWLHFAGTSCAIVFIAAAVVLGPPWLLLAAPVAAYGFAWIAHFTVERNRPATFTYPLWSLLGDFKMYGLMWAGKMDAEVAKMTARESGR